MIETPVRRHDRPPTRSRTRRVRMGESTAVPLLLSHFLATTTYKTPLAPSPPAHQEREEVGHSTRQRDEDLLTALGDPASRKILLALDPTPLPVHDLVRVLDLPQSTVYHKLHELEQAGLVTIESVPLTPEGKRVELFRSLVKSARMEMDAGRVSVKVRYRHVGPGPIDSVLHVLGKRMRR